MTKIKLETPVFSLEDVDRLSTFFKVLGDPTRMRICLELAEETLCVCDLSANLGMSESAVSHQLRILKQSRIIGGRKEGKHVYYSLKDRHVSNILNQTREHLDES